MAKIKSKNTKFEQNFFDFLKRGGISFHKHPKNIFGKPDILFKKNKVLVFLDSDFWHGWKYRHGEKFKKN